MEKKYDIFISYRRNGGETTAVLLKSELSHLGYNVFLDFDNLPIGGKFEERIEEVIKSSGLFLFLYSPGCIDRCKNKKDVLRKEIKCAIDNNVQILTLNINLATTNYFFPPEGIGIPKFIIDKLGQHNFLDFFTGQYKQNSLNRLAEFLATTDLGFQKKQCTLKLLSEVDAILLINGEEWTAMQANTIKYIQVDYGKYKVQFKPVNEYYYNSTKEEEIIAAIPIKEITVPTRAFEIKKYEISEEEEKDLETMAPADLNEKGWKYQLENNPHMAIMCWTVAAELGNPTAQYSLGYNYSKGEFLPRDDVKAFKWYKKAARQGDSRSQFLLGDAFYYGTGTIRNFDKAVIWYQKAADQGNAKALYSLACCYHKGQGVPHTDLKKAFELYLEAANRGYHNAQLLVARFYEDPKEDAIEQNLQEALKWYERAANQGSETGKIYYERLKEKL